MRGRTRALAAALITSVALLATACQGGGGTVAGGEGGTKAISIRGCTPENPLIPGATSEVCGGNIIDAFTAKLIHYNADTAAPEMDIAESIESDDNTTFTVKLKQGYMFQDGTEVKAHNFVDAWNYTMYGPNGQAGSYFYNAVEGFEDLQCGAGEDGQPDCDANPPKAEEATGLEVVDDYTFTITTKQPVSNLPVRLGYSAFAPLPDSFFDDPKAFEDNPIGAGPFKVTEIDETKIVLEKFEDYAGEYKPFVDEVTFRIYTNDATAYNDVVANNLDITDVIPTANLQGDLYKTDLPDRNGLKETGNLTWLTFSPVDDQFTDNKDLRHAISMAVDREEITKQIFAGTATPADTWVSPAVDGYKPGTCGEFCTFDPEKAKQLYEKSGGYDGTLVLTVNNNGSNKDYAEAICNQLKNTLGIDCRPNVLVDFATFNKKIDADELKGIFRSGWQMDYPSIENFLTPIYVKGADSNWSKYDNPEFQKVLNEAAAQDTGEAANAKYQEAEAILAEDFPTAPLWYEATAFGWSDNVTDVKLNAFGVIDLTQVKMA